MGLDVALVVPAQFPLIGLEPGGYPSRRGHLELLKVRRIVDTASVADDFLEAIGLVRSAEQHPVTMAAGAGGLAGSRPDVVAKA